jgi:hypothetical protein
LNAPPQDLEELAAYGQQRTVLFVAVPFVACLLSYGLYTMLFM